jgi:hypothetical protein
VGLALEEAGDVSVTGTVGAHGLRGAVAVRLPAGVGVVAARQRGVQVLSNRVLAYPDSVDTRHDLLVLGVGLHLPVPSPYTASLYAGRGTGRSEAYSPRSGGYLFTDEEFASADVEQWFVQPSMGRTVGPGTVSLTMGVSRLAYTDLTVVQAPFAGPQSVRNAAESRRWYVEPALSTQFGRGPLRVSTSVGLSLALPRASAPSQPSHRPFHLGVGAVLRLNDLFGGGGAGS